MLKSLLNRFLPQVEAAPAAGPVAAPQDIGRADALIAEGDAREAAGDLLQAEVLYRQAVAAAPGHARAHLNLGIALAAKGDEDAAAAAYEQVLAIDAGHPFGNYNYARLAFTRGDLERADALVAAALRARPEFPQALVLQSNVLDALGRRGPAIDAIRAALRLQPDDTGAWFNLALMLQKAGRPDEMDVAVQRALAIEPDNLPVLELAFRALHAAGFAQEALVPLRKVLRLDPMSWPLRSMELLLMNFVEGVSAQELYRRHVQFGVDRERAVAQRFEHRRGRGDLDRRLRVGYLSSDLVLHPVSMFLAPLLEQHDRSNVEVFCYATKDRSDPMTERLRAAAEHWREAAALSDDELADAIHADGIDVLVDLMGHSSDQRLGVFCQRPAPVQVAWLGYLNTTGLTRMDFRITDVRCDPPALSQPLHTERLLPLPASQWCYQPMGDMAIAPVAPVERNGHVTFGCFNSTLKITSASCRRWAEILSRLPGSRLLIGDLNSDRKRAAILRDITALGVAEDRIEFLPRLALGEYLTVYNRVDITLDTYPYGGGTTTFDSLWMGVPVVAALGETPVSRSAASILTALSLEDWIAPSGDAYVDVALARAADRAALLALRAGLRERMRDSLLMELPRFTRDLEAAYRAMWRDKTA